MNARWRPRASRALWALVLLASPVALAAHESGSTRVTATVHRDSIQVEINTDADALLEKLETAAGESTDHPTGPAALAQRLQGLDEVFRTRATIRADGTPVSTVAHYAVISSAPDPPRAVVTMTADVPSASRTLTWKFGWTFTVYAFDTRQEGVGLTSTGQLEGGEESHSIAVASRPAERKQFLTKFLALGFSRVLPHGLEQVLFVLGLALLGRTAGATVVPLTAFCLAEAIAAAAWRSHLAAIVPPSAVQPLVLLSLIYVSVENFVVSRRRWQGVAALFSFGLIHGLSIATALQGQHDRVETVTFILGAAAAQLTVAFGAGLLVERSYRESAWYRHRIMVPASFAIGCTAAYWGLIRM